MRTTFGVDSAYVPESRRRGTDNPLATTMQWSRRFAGLKVFMVFAHHGLSGVAARIERQKALGDRLRQRLVEGGFRVLNSTPLPVVCFSHPSIDSGQVAPADVVRYLAESQIAWISKTTLRRRVTVLRACLTNFDTEEADLLRLTEGLTQAIEHFATTGASRGER